MALVDQLRAVLADRADLELAILFGSLARGAGTDGSDVDVAIQGQVDRLSLARDLSIELGREVDVVDLAEVGHPLLESIVRDGIVLHQGRRGAAGRWLSSAIARLETDRAWYRRMRDAYLAGLAGASR